MKAEFLVRFMNSEIENHSARISQEFPEMSACTWVVVLHCTVFGYLCYFLCERDTEDERYQCWHH